MRFITPFSPFDRTQGRVRGEKNGSTDFKLSSRFDGVGAFRQNKRIRELRSLSLGTYHTVG